MPVNPNEVIQWREALISLSDQYFFDLVRMYLGAVKTPFNKQRIVEELSAFLRKRERRDAILASLDGFDLMVLSAVAELPSPTQQKIVSLFSGTRSFPEIYDRILNLEERLVIYRKSAEASREYALNPLLKDELLPRLGFHVLASPVSRGEATFAQIPVDDIALASLYSFFLHAGEPVRNDGTLRKKTLAALAAAFPLLAERPECSRLLLAAFQNLGLLVILEGNLVPDTARWQAFARISRAERIAWLAAAATGKLPREALQRRAQLYIDFVAALEGDGRYDRETVARLAFLLSERAGREPGARQYGRFATMLRSRALERPESGPVAGGESPDHADKSAPHAPLHQGGASLVDVAIAFGILVETDGALARNEDVFGAEDTAGSLAIVVSPAFSVTVMPGGSLAELLPLAACMEARDVQIVARFEITRRSCASAFELGETAESIATLLKSRSDRPIPQNVLFSIDDWYRGYASISLYHGFVLRVDESRRVLFENNAHLSSLILRALAPGVYLLDAGEPQAIQEAFAAAGLEPPPAVSNVAPKREAVRLPPLLVHANESAPSSSPERPDRASGRSDSPVGSPLPDAAEDLRVSLRKELEGLGLDPEIADALRSRIDRRIALSSEQLDPESVRIEKVEARGMDFLGKVRIAEYAITTGSLLEVSYDDRDGDKTTLGRPVSTEKRMGDVLLKIVTEPDRSIETLSLGKAALVRRIRGSIFSDLPPGRG